MKKRNKAQIAVFIIIALVIVIAVAIYLLTNKTNDQETFNLLPFNQQVEVLHQLIRACMIQTYEQSLDNIGMQGGYYNEPLTPYLTLGIQNIPLYHLGKMLYVPSLDFIEEEIAASVELRETDCLSLINGKNIDYSYNYRAPTISIQNESVIFTPHIDLTLKKDENTQVISFETAPIEIISNLKEMNRFASYITLEHELKKGSLCISCFTEITNTNKLKVEFSNEIDSILLVKIRDYSGNYHPIEYSFALAELTTYDNNEFLVDILQNTQSELNEEDAISQPPSI